MSEGRFVRYYVKANDLQSTSADFVNYFGNNTSDITRTFEFRAETFVLIISTDKADQHLKLLTNGTYTKINESQYEKAVDGTFPIILMDPKYKIKDLHGKRLNNFTARFGLLKSNERIKGQEVLTLVKLNLDRPSQGNVTDMTGRVDPVKLEHLINNDWPPELRAHLVLPKFAPSGKSKSAEIPGKTAIVTPSAPPAHAVAHGNDEVTLNSLVAIFNDMNNRIQMLDY